MNATTEEHDPLSLFPEPATIHAALCEAVQQERLLRKQLKLSMVAQEARRARQGQLRAPAAGVEGTT